MSLRLRLSLCYGILFALILPLVMVLSYAIHARGQYDDLDRTLVVSAGHVAAEATTFASGSHLVQERGSLEVALRLYSARGILLESSSGGKSVPATDPKRVLHTPAGLAYDPVVQLVPPLMGSVTSPSSGAFGLLFTTTQRWRVYVLPIEHTGTVTGYVEALTPLGRLDAAMQEFRVILVIVALSSLALALGGSWIIAGRALRPVGKLVQIAQSIALSRDLSRRIEVPAHHDELTRLAMTFNEMLASLEKASVMQQRFVSDASHEMRAPLTAIQGNLELLNRHPDMALDDRTEALVEITREAQRLTRLVTDLLVLARADAGITLKRCPVDLDPLVLEVFREARHLAQRHTLVLEPFQPAKVEGNEDKLKQLLLILLDNALKYTPAGGQVIIGMRRLEEDVEVIVSDSGVGIAPEDRPHIFERFYRADPARGRDPGGTGLGLPIAEWIVEQHEGRIMVESSPCQGTTMRVYLPLCRCS